MSTRDRDPLHLLPALARAVPKIDAALSKAGLHFKLFETHRSRELQTAGVQNGTSKAVMWQSYHNYGAAIDYVWNDTGWSWDDKHPWTKLGEVYESIGLEWGGRWAGFYDAPHGQIRTYGSRQALGVASYLDRKQVEAERKTAGSTRALFDWLQWFVQQIKPFVHDGDYRIATAIVQNLTALAGADPGTVDGIWGRKTQLALDSCAGGVPKDKRQGPTPEVFAHLIQNIRQLHG